MIFGGTTVMDSASIVQVRPVLQIYVLYGKAPEAVLDCRKSCMILYCICTIGI